MSPFIYDSILDRFDLRHIFGVLKIYVPVQKNRMKYILEFSSSSNFCSVPFHDRQISILIITGGNHKTKNDMTANFFFFSLAVAYYLNKHDLYRHMLYALYALYRQAWSRSSITTFFWYLFCYNFSICLAFHRSTTSYILQINRFY